MLLKSAIKLVTWRLVQLPFMGWIIIACWERWPSATNWNRRHPYDRLHRVKTSGYVAGFIVTPGLSTAYGAAQPSIIRKALENIPNPRGCHFVDLGCGKGRPLLIASEFDFAAITGVELSPTLCQVARGNAAIVSRTHSGRTPIAIVEGDALKYKLPAEPLLIFLYNPFDRLLMMKLISRIGASLCAAPRDLYVVYYNPVWADLFDAFSMLERRYAAHIPYDTSEIGYGPNTSDAVIIWQNKDNPHPPLPGCDTPIRNVAPGRVELADYAPVAVGSPPSA